MRLALLLSLMLVTGSAFADDAPERALKLHDEAKQLYARGNYNEAVDKLELAVELAGKLLEEQVTDADRTRLIDEFIGRVEQGRSA